MMMLPQRNGLLVFALAALLAAASPASADLVANWAMNEASWNGTSGEVLDSSGNGHNGTSYNSANTIEGGKFDRAGSFNGTARGRVQVADAADLDGMAAFSISAWIKIAPTGSYSTSYAIAAKQYSNTSGYRGWSLTYAARGNTDPGTYEQQAATLALTNNSDTLAQLNSGWISGLGFGWNQVVATYDGTTMRMYINGADTGVTASLTGSLIANAYPVYIAGRTGNIYDADLDDIGIWDHALTQTEITAIYNSPIVPEPATLSVLILGSLGALARRHRRT